MVGGSRLSHQSGDIGANHRELLHDDKKQDLKSNLTTLDENCRELAARVVFGEQTRKGKVRIFEEDEEERRNRVLAKMLLRAALEDEEDDEYKVIEEDQKSLSVGIIGAPNAGKSTLTNFMVKHKDKSSLFASEIPKTKWVLLNQYRKNQSTNSLSRLELRLLLFHGRQIRLLMKF
ncbi:hypothetical protein ACOSQ3_010224 [Xanthoceras sorbifolium]